MQVWRLASGKQEWLFTSRELAVRSVEVSHSSLDVKILELGQSTVLVQPTEGPDVWFSLELAVDGDVLDRVEHL